MQGEVSGLDGNATSVRAQDDPSIQLATECTVGGFDWLRKRGILKDVKGSVQHIVQQIKSGRLQLSLFDPPSPPPVEQLALFPE